MNIQRLYDILSLKRGHGSVGEQRMIDEVIMPFNPHVFTTQTGEVLAYHLSNPSPEGAPHPTTLFCAHTDTVHGNGVKRNDGSYVNRWTYDTGTNIIHADGDVLGADDGAGVWLLLEMYEAGVPGDYLFHRGEECGGIGSSGMVENFATFLSSFDRAIAFDRKGTHSIITHQRFYDRCCSDKFAEALAFELTCDTYFYSCDDTGVFTDTANYTDLIGECTNVSVGYYDEHTAKERLDLGYLLALRRKCIALDWENLPTVRAPGEVDFHPVVSKFGRSYGYEFDYGINKTAITINELYDMSFEELEDFCYDFPEEAARLMQELMFGFEADPVGNYVDGEEDSDNLDVGMK
jgi:hypothetical protein